MHELTHVEVQTLDKYTINTKMHEDPSFAENFILSRLLTIDQISSPIQLRDDAVDVAEFVHVCGADDGRDKVLGPVDEEALLKSLGSVSAKNKLRSALAIGAKARQVALKQHGKRIRKLNYDLQMGDVHTVIVGQSRMVRCSMDGIYVRTRVPLDSIVVLYVTAGLTVWACHALVTLEGAGSLGEAASLGLALILGISVTYNNLRYNSWSIGQTVRLRRMCVSDEDMRKCMSRADSIRTIAHAGANGTGMDDILTCAYSNATNGSFSVTEPLSLTDAANAGLFLRLSTQLTPLWIDMRGVRAVDITERSYMWHATGEYLDKTYLQLTCSGPDHIGSGNLPM